MLAELRTPEQFLCSMYLKSGKAILREQKLFFFPVKKPHSEEISSGAILGTNLSFTKGGRGVSEFCAGPSNQLRANLSLQLQREKVAGRAHHLQLLVQHLVQQCNLKKCKI